MNMIVLGRILDMCPNIIRNTGRDSRGEVYISQRESRRRFFILCTDPDPVRRLKGTNTHPNGHMGKKL